MHFFDYPYFFLYVINFFSFFCILNPDFLFVFFLKNWILLQLK